MRPYYYYVQEVKKSKGDSAVAFSSYISGEKLKSERDGKEYDKGHGGVVYKEVMLPDHVPEEFSDREYLWNSVEKVEKHPKAVFARKYLFGLDFDLPVDDIINILRGYLKENFVSRGMICDFAVHEPDAGCKTLHVHMLCPTREMDEEGGWKGKYVLRYRDLDNGEKVLRSYRATDWGDFDTLEKWKRNWENTWNPILAELGLEEIRKISSKALGFTFINLVRESFMVRARTEKGQPTEVHEINDMIDRTNQDNRRLYLERAELKDDIARLEKQHDALLLGFGRDLIPRLGKAQYTLLRDTSDPDSGKENAFRILYVYGFRPGDRLEYVRDLRDGIADYRKFIEKQAKKDSDEIDEAVKIIRRGEAYNRDCLAVFRQYSSLPPVSKSVYYLTHKKDIWSWKEAYEDLRDHIGPDGEFESGTLKKKIETLRIDLIEKLAELEELDFQLPILEDALKVAEDDPGSYENWLVKAISEMELEEAADDTVYISSAPVRSGFEPEL